MHVQGNVIHFPSQVKAKSTSTLAKMKTLWHTRRIFHYKTISATLLVTERVVSMKFKTPQNGLFVNLLITLALH